MTACCNHTIGAVFNGFAVLIAARMKSQGAGPQEAMAFFVLANQLSGMVNALVWLWVQFKDLVRRYREMEDFLETPFVETDEGLSPASKEWPEQGRIEFEAVTFRYAPHTPAALRLYRTILYLYLYYTVLYYTIL